MPPSPTDATPALPAYVLALVLLGGLSAIGGLVWEQIRMAPGTLLTPGAEAAVASPNSTRVAAPAAASVGGYAVGQAEAGPDWATLNTAQKLALYPLAERWARISESQKRRWLTLAASFSTLSEEEQQKFHDRITDWANLSAQQRNQARLNYAVTTRLAPDDKRAQWEAYQALSDSERRALAARAAPKPTGAATALRPVSRKKLAQVPAAVDVNPSRPNAPKIPPVVEHSTRIVVPPISAPLAPSNAPPATPSGSFVAPSQGVETAPVAVPFAVPSPLPPLPASATIPDAPSTTTAPLPVTPDTSGLYPQ